jgi:nucleotide-binding universal stress UspA family protein
MATLLPPFPRLLVPYDGSDPARAALTFALAITTGDANITLINVVDETTVMAQSVSSSTVAFDPTPLMEALDAQGTAVLDDALATCRAANVSATKELMHEMPVAGILAAINEHAVDLVIMGTHARKGVARAFLGSTTEAVLRSSRIPVLTVRTVDRVGSAPFATALVAVDDSEPADAAVAVAAKLARTAGTQIIAAHAIDTAPIYENALNYGFDPEQIAGDMRSEGTAIVQRSLQRAALAPDTSVAIVEGHPADALIKEADARHATVLITGSHGRRGLRRFFLGSVAESIVRNSDIPVLVVPGAQANATRSS